MNVENLFLNKKQKSATDESEILYPSASTANFIACESDKVPQYQNHLSYVQLTAKKFEQLYKIESCPANLHPLANKIFIKNEQADQMNKKKMCQVKKDEIAENLISKEKFTQTRLFNESHDARRYTTLVTRMFTYSLKLCHHLQKKFFWTILFD